MEIADSMETLCRFAADIAATRVTDRQFFPDF
jgi:hypothetical protein